MSTSPAASLVGVVRIGPNGYGQEMGLERSKTSSVSERGNGFIAVLMVAVVALLAAATVALARAEAAGVETAAGRSSSLAGSADCAAPSWVAAWTASPQDSSAVQEPGSAPGGPDEAERQVFEDQTLRMIVTPNAAGSRLRLHLSNRFGVDPVSFAAVHVAKRLHGPSIVPGTDRTVTFAGSPSVTVDAGTTAVSDEVDLVVEPFADLVVSIHVPGPSPLDVHLFAQQTQYATPAGAGDHTSDGGGEAFTDGLGSWLALTAVDVLAPRGQGAVVALGDSITDGTGSTPDANRRWPDQLARRLFTDPAAPPLTVVNAGIGGNQVSRDNVLSRSEIGWGRGLSAAMRFAADVAAQAGVTDVVVFIGINDLYMPTAPDPVRAITDGYLAIRDQARAAGLRAIGATVTPGALPPDKEEQRQAVNQWIRSSGAFDVVVDFDAVVRDPTDPAKLDERYAADPVHLNDDGYAALAASIDPAIFRGNGCPP